MDENKKKELFSIAYIKAMLAQGGLNYSKPEVDDDSVDLQIIGRGYRQAKIRSPQIEVQIKCTSNFLVKDGFFSFTLKIKNYNDLRGYDFAVPRYLFIILVPDDSNDWLIHGNDFGQIKHACYWYSLRDAVEVDNLASVTLSIPIAQRVTSQVLLDMMSMASMGDVYE